MKFSIIVPVYNSEKYISKAIESVLVQKYQNYELILVDDGSTDNGKKIIDSYLKNNNKIKYFYKQNSGPGLARKYGYDRCKGDLIYFLDSDDWLPNSDTLQKIYDVFNNNNDVDLVIFNRLLVPEKIVLFPFGKNNIKTGKYDLSIFEENVIRGGLGLKVLKSKIISDEMFIESSNHEDYYTTYLYLNKCKKLYYLNEELYVVNRYEENLSLTKKYDFNDKIKGMETVIKMYDCVSDCSLKKSISILSFNVLLAYYFIPLLKLMVSNQNARKSKKNIMRMKKIIKENKIDNVIKKMDWKKRIIYYLFIKR